MTVWIRCWLCSVILIALGCAAQELAQNKKTEETRDTTMNSLVNRAVWNSQSVMHAVDDGKTSLQWLLVKDQQNPSAPGRLLPVQASSRTSSAEPVCYVIKTGERVIAEEHTPVFDARLDAIALESSSAGARTRVRLKLGGRIVDAIAKGPGLVTMTTGEGGHR